MDTASFDQVPYSKLVERVDQGNICVIELLQLFRAKLELEEKNIAFATKVSRQNIYEHEIAKSTSEKSLGMMKNYYIFLSQDQVKYHSGLLEIVRKLDGVRLYCTSEVAKCKEVVQNATKDVGKAYIALDKAKRNFAKAKLEVEHTKAKLLNVQQVFLEWERANEEKRREREKDPTHSSSKFSMGRMLSAFETTPEQDRDKQVRKLAKRQYHLMECSAEIAAKKKALLVRIEERDSAIQMATISFETTELERITQTQACMHAFCELERHSLEKRCKNLTKFEAAASGVDVEGDMSLYISKEKEIERTHKQARAIAILDWDFNRRRKNEEDEFDIYNVRPTIDGEDGVEKDIMQLPGVAMDDDLDSDSPTRPPQTPPVRRSTTRIEDSNRKSSIDPLGAMIGNSDSNVESEVEEDAVEGSAFHDVDPLLQAALESRPRRSNEFGEIDLEDSLRLSNGQSEGNNGGIESKMDLPTSRVSFVVRSLLHQRVSSRPSSALHALLENLSDDANHSETSDEIIEAMYPDTVDQLQTSDEMNSVGIEEFPVTEESWTELLELQGPRMMFLKELDEFRGSHGLMSPAAFSVMTVAMKVFLDRCEEHNDVKSAMRIANMANTFHKLIQAEQVKLRSVSSSSVDSACREPNEPTNSVVAAALDAEQQISPTSLESLAADKDKEGIEKSDTSENSLAGEAASSEPITTTTATTTVATSVEPVSTHTSVNTPSLRREYLQQEPELRDHSIWRAEGFWDAALMEGLSQELDHRDPVLWDELSSESLNEAIIDIHNVVFGQLGTMAFTMHGVGLSALEVEKRMMNMSRGAQLNEEQEHELLRSVRRTYGLPVDFRQGSRYHSTASTTKGISRRRESWRDPSVFADGVVGYVGEIVSEITGAVAPTHQPQQQKPLQESVQEEPRTSDASGAADDVDRQSTVQKNTVATAASAIASAVPTPSNSGSSTNNSGSGNSANNNSSNNTSNANSSKRKSGLAAAIFGSSSSSNSSKSKVKQIPVDDEFFAVL